jgi:hypothetical protein
VFALPSLAQRWPGVALRLIVAGACCFGIWRSFDFARADYQFQQNTETSIRSAIRLVPDNWEYSMRLAQFDREHARELLAESLRQNKFNAQADVELALDEEMEGDVGRAEQLLLDAYAVDHTYLPRWSLANFYLRRDDLPKFWQWAKLAAEMPSNNVGPLFELCWRVSPDPDKISNAVLNDNPAVIRQYIAFLLSKDRLHTVSLVAPRLVRDGDRETDTPLIFDIVNRLISAQDASPALALWHSLIDRHWIVADATLPNNADFEREPLSVGLDWSLPEYPGMHSWPGASGLQTEFTGSQPENCTVAEQTVPLAPGNYTMEYVYHTSDIPPSTGVRWQIVETKTGALLAESSDLSSDVVQQSALDFAVPQGVSFARLRLVYRRTLGTTRIAGTLTMRSIRIQAKS